MGYPQVKLTPYDSDHFIHAIFYLNVAVKLIDENNYFNINRGYKKSKYLKYSVIFILKIFGEKL